MSEGKAVCNRASAMVTIPSGSSAEDASKLEGYGFFCCVFGFSIEGSVSHQPHHSIANSTALGLSCRSPSRASERRSSLFWELLPWR